MGDGDGLACADNNHTVSILPLAVLEQLWTRSHGRSRGVVKSREALPSRRHQVEAHRRGQRLRSVPSVDSVCQGCVVCQARSVGSVGIVCLRPVDPARGDGLGLEHRLDQVEEARERRKDNRLRATTTTTTMALRARRGDRRRTRGWGATEI
eukprot:6188215-Pleurochrysis_carterae.AAC.3